MVKLWICLTILVLASASYGQDFAESGQLDGWDNSWYDDLLKNAVEDPPDEANNENNYEDIDDDTLFKDVAYEDKPDDGGINNDYQIEDNRSIQKEQEQEEAEIDSLAGEKKTDNEILNERPVIPSESNISSQEVPEDGEINKPEPEKEKIGEDEDVNNNQEIGEAPEASLEELAQDTILKDIPAVSDAEKISDAAPVIEEVVENANEEIPSENIDTNDNPQSAEIEEISLNGNSDLEQPLLRLDPLVELQSNIVSQDNKGFADDSVVNDNTVKETEGVDQLLSETNKMSMEEGGLVKEEDNGQKNNNELDFDDLPDEDTFNKIYDDLNSDLNKLMETWKKLSSNDTEIEKNPDDTINPDNIADYEEKYGRPFREGVVLSQRDDYYEDAKVNENSAIAPNEVLETSVVTNKDDGNSDNINGQKSSFEEEVETNLDKGLNELVNANVENVKSEEEIIEDRNALDGMVNDSDSGEASKDEKLYNCLQPETVVNNLPDETIGNEKDTVVADGATIITNNDETIPKQDVDEVEPMPVSEIGPAQYDQIMQQFKLVHSDDLSIPEKVDNDGVTTISVNDITEIVSPSYPDPYPVDAVTDWIFEGEGLGIEFNLTELQVNGVQGDYLLVKPDGVDETGQDGLVFSYYLKEPRRYRFLNAQRLFVRFVAGPGLQTSEPGTYKFKFSVKMVSPLPEMDEWVPEPPPSIPEPRAIHTIHLDISDRNLTYFRDTMQEDMRILLASMATTYIYANNIEMGLNNTNETTRITGIGVCHLSWPNAHRCAELSFAVSLVYEDQDEDNYRLNQTDLETMWNTYSRRDPFMSWLRMMDVTEFSRPDDKDVMTIWLLIGAGVIICMVMLAFAMHRYSCCESYSRMPDMSDTASIYNEKKGLDLYPTPHQPLPSLYDMEYQWDLEDSTRVDRGGFTNPNYVRDQMYDIESDEDAHDGRVRITSQQPINA